MRRNESAERRREMVTREEMKHGRPIASLVISSIYCDGLSPKWSGRWIVDSDRRIDGRRREINRQADLLLRHGRCSGVIHAGGMRAGNKSRSAYIKARLALLRRRCRYYVRGIVSCAADKISQTAPRVRVRLCAASPLRFAPCYRYSKVALNAADTYRQRGSAGPPQPCIIKHC